MLNILPTQSAAITATLYCLKFQTFDVKGKVPINKLLKFSGSCGIYLLHFKNGEFYVGQTTNVARRYAKHRRKYRDIEVISFKPVNEIELNRTEREIITELEREGFLLRNKDKRTVKERSIRKHISLDRCLTLEDKTVFDQISMTGMEPLKVLLWEILDSLSERERKVLELRFGLTDNQEHTLEEVGRRFGCCDEWARQIEQKALRKLRHPIRSRKLRDYL